MDNIRFMVIGQGRHGKDTFSEILESSEGYTFTSSSFFASEKVVYPILKKKYGYSNHEECFGDRHNHRADWYNIIHQYNNPRLYRLAQEVYKENDIYCGLRHIEEFYAIKRKGLFDVCVWVDAEERLGKTEDSDSMTLRKEDADFIVYNNGTKKEFIESVNKFYKKLNTDYNIRNKQ